MLASLLFSFMIGVKPFGERMSEGGKPDDEAAGLRYGISQMRLTSKGEFVGVDEYFPKIGEQRADA